MKIYLLNPPCQIQANVLNRHKQILGSNGWGQSPYSYINNKVKLSPTSRAMSGIIDEKIRSW